jgi:hypothetical protein
MDMKSFIVIEPKRRVPSRWDDADRMEKPMSGYTRRMEPGSDSASSLSTVIVHSILRRVNSERCKLRTAAPKLALSSSFPTRKLRSKFAGSPNISDP